MVRSIAKGQAAHPRLDTQDVVVDREQLLQSCLVVGLHLDRHLGIVNAREVASAGRLVLLGLQSEGVHVDTGVGGAGVVVEGLDLVEVVAVLLLEAVLTVEDHLEQVQRTHLDTHTTGDDGAVDELGALLDPVGVAGEAGACAETDVGCDDTSCGDQLGHTGHVGHDVVVGRLQGQHVGGHVHVASGRAEVPHAVQLSGRASTGVGVAPHQLLHWVVEGQTDKLH